MVWPHTRLAALAPCRPWRVSRLGGQRGFSLVELLVASTLALWVLTALFTLARGSLISVRAGAALGQMSEEASAVLAQLRLFVSQAGYSTAMASQTSSGGLQRVWQQRPVFGCDGPFASLAAPIEALACTNTGDTRRAALAVAFLADQANSLPGSDGLPMDCAGNQIEPDTAAPSGTRYHLSYNRFYRVGFTLFCKGSGGAGQPLALAENVQAFSVRYGVASLQGGRVGAYVTAAQVPDWRAVVAIQLCLVLRSSEDGLLPEPMLYPGCDESASTVRALDRRLYRAYTSTVRLLNPGSRAPGVPA